MPLRTFRFEFLGRPYEAAGDDPRLFDLLDRFFPAALDDTAPASAATARFEARLAGAEPRLTGPGGDDLLDRRNPVWHAYVRIVETVLGDVDSHFLLHAAALETEGAALLVSAPTRFGKTTLSIHLVARGLRFLADDVAALDRRSRRILWSPRPLNLRPGTRRMLPADRLRAAEAATTRRFGDEWIVDPARWLGPPPAPAVPAAVALLRPSADADDVRRFDRLEIRFRAGREDLALDLAAVPGVAGVESRSDSPGGWIAAVDDPTSLDAWLRERRTEIAWLTKYTSEPPDFSREPEVRPLGTFQAALELAQEMQNRHPGSRLDSEFAGREALLVAEMAESLGSARCYAVVPGRLDATVAVLESMVRDRPR